jgi:hypothetical protein
MPRKPRPDLVRYNTTLDVDRQVTMEEKIAARIFDDPDIETNEEVASQLGRDILALILPEFCPEFVKGYEKTGDTA